MTNTNMLREKISGSGYKIRFIAEKCGITYQAFLNRMNGSIEFRMDEVRELQSLLNLTPEEVHAIFFAENSDK